MLLIAAQHSELGMSLFALGWIHLVALGWLTMTALSVLIHVIPTFTETTLRGERIARSSLGLYAAGVFALVAAFCAGSVAALPLGATVISLALVSYLVPCALTLAGALSQTRVQAAIGRALGVTLTSLITAAFLGAALAWGLARGGSPMLLSRGPAIHASFGMIGWLTVLVMGVSTRTVRPITGSPSPRRWTHIAAGSGAIVGMLLLVAGLSFAERIVQWTGAIVVALATMTYVGDLAVVLRRATVTHRPPQAFLAAGALWLVVGLALSLGSLAGAGVGRAAIYVLLVGWVGQIVNAHIHHIGIRLIATMVRGEDDETEPAELLSSRLSWTCFAFFQAAVAAGGVALAFGRPALLSIAALCGLAGWTAQLGNIATSVRRARSVGTA
ncbi:MAG: hypothetical protein DLM53_11595 [Candidatus Eremiobacter antarcticus]|nr:hypothetical protein [Candidatus Eremiobacteraeota bacterium]MBC5809020.1 hypothetical protein [Candidatus Eremiobacteraeota bacterium]PZR60307.1 MAG: hypothetical protein DLM53_11595 [Candidatus Eremiobacter sp. RRmetagenome_bin22]